MNLPIKAVLTITSLAIFASSGAHAAGKTQGSLTVRVSGMKTKAGKVIVHLFRPGDKVTGRPYRRIIQRNAARAMVFRFSNIPFQNYYAMAIHDKNGNGLLDHNALRMPDEPIGFSNNWKLSIFSGMPNYKKTGFTFSKSRTSIAIKVR